MPACSRKAQFQGIPLTKLWFAVLATIALGEWIEPLGLLAQAHPIRVVTLSVGPSLYRLPELGHGTAMVASGSLHWRGKSPLQPQIGLTSWIETVHFDLPPFETTEIKQALIPELGVRLAGTGSVVRPYLSAGLGYLLSLGGLHSGVTLYASSGMDWHVRGHWGLRADARLRSVRPFAGRTLDLSLGLNRSW